MADRSEQVGEGTLYDPEGNELATVAYRIAPASREDDDVDAWCGELFFADPSMTVEPGLYALETETGAEVEIQIEPAGSAGGDPRTVSFNGVGSPPRGGA